MRTVAYSITVDDAHLGATQAIAQTIGTRGFVVDRIIAAVGAIRAFGDDKAAERVRNIEGVLEVRQEHTFVLPRVDEKIPL